MRRLSTHRRGLRALHRNTVDRLQIVEREYRRLHSLLLAIDLTSGSEWERCMKRIDLYGLTLEEDPTIAAKE